MKDEAEARRDAAHLRRPEGRGKKMANDFTETLIVDHDIVNPESELNMTKWRQSRIGVFHFPRVPVVGEEIVGETWSGVVRHVNWHKRYGTYKMSPTVEVEVMDSWESQSSD